MKNYRYAIDFDTSKIEKEYCDCLILGSGIAGVYTALEIPSNIGVKIITKDKIEGGNTALAQGGIAVCLDKDDSTQLHLNDTLFAGAGLCEESVVRTLVEDAQFNIKNLFTYGVEFDKYPDNNLKLTREAAHSKNRIVHSGDSTGKEVSNKLILEIRRRKNINIEENVIAIDILLKDEKCYGVIAFDEKNNKLKIYITKIVVCATGGLGQVYKNTTNPEVSTGDGVALALRAGAEVMDMEFIQFHPTVLNHPKNNTFLISEAVRGEGALLKNDKNEEFMEKYHELKDLAPRDIVSRAIFKEISKTDKTNVYLDISFKKDTYIKQRFPNIYKTLLDLDIDITKDLIPVSPAEHYAMGGIRTDINGKTSIEGLYACGECACNGIHGANRLASNSLLEGIVFGKKISNNIEKYIKETPDIEFEDFKYETDRKDSKVNLSKILSHSRDTMIEYVGIIRDEKGLNKAKEIINLNIEKINKCNQISLKYFDVKNILDTSLAIIENALARKESRGAHYRDDYPNRDDENFIKHIIYKYPVGE